MSEEEKALLAQMQAQSAADQAAWAKKWAAMTPAEQQAHREKFASLRRKMQSSVGND